MKEISDSGTTIFLSSSATTEFKTHHFDERTSIVVSSPRKQSTTGKSISQLLNMQLSYSVVHLLLIAASLLLLVPATLVQADDDGSSTSTNSSSSSIYNNDDSKSFRPPVVDPSKCMLLTSTSTCGAFSEFSVPTSVFRSVDDFDQFIRKQVALRVADAQQNCTNGGQLSYVRGLTTAVCHEALAVFWRTYQCGRGGLFGVGCEPPVLCVETCRRFWEGYNGVAGQCVREKSTRGIAPVNVDERCAPGVAGTSADKSVCVESGAVRVVLNVVGAVALTMAVMVV